MAKILILTLGSRGDVQPYVALGVALTRRGHEVAVSTGQGFDDLITGHGLASVPLSVDILALIDTPEIQAAMKSLRGKWRAFRSTKALMMRQLDDMWAIARDIAPDIIVYHPKAYPAPYLARALGAIAIPSFLQPGFAPTGAFPTPLVQIPDFLRVTNRVSHRMMLALMRLGTGTLFRPWLQGNPDVAASPRLDLLAGYHPRARAIPRLHAHSAHVVPKPSDWGEGEHVTGYWFLPETTSFEPPADLVDFLDDGSPPVYVGFGSMPSIDTDKTARAVMGAVQGTGTRAIVARGWGALAGAASTGAVHVLDSAPHDWLFPRCAAVIHHGGAGTTHEGLRWGRPTLVCPLFGDQPFWGRIVNDLGAGPKPIPLRTLTEQNLSAALTELVSGVFDDHSRTLGERIQTETGAATAADLIEGVVLG